MYHQFSNPERAVASHANKAVITHRGVFWECGGCGMKNTPTEPGCRLCGSPNF